MAKRMFLCISNRLIRHFKAYTMVQAKLHWFKSGRGTRASIEKVQAATIKKTMLTRNFFRNFVGYECIANNSKLLSLCSFVPALIEIYLETDG